MSDRGPGVPWDIRGRIFERFARGAGDTASGGGSGLGLAIVRAVAEAHGGRVELLDAEGGGARFVVSLPLGLESELSAESPGRPTAPSPGAPIRPLRCSGFEPEPDP